MDRSGGLTDTRYPVFRHPITMTHRRFYAPVESIAPGENISLSEDESKHLVNVLRLAPNDEVFAFDGRGKEYRCTVQTAGRNAELKVVEEVTPASPESTLDLTLAIALLKGDKFDLVVQKVTELGVKTIIPVAASRADVRLDNSSGARKRVARWQRVALEAAKQSGRAFVPVIKELARFEEVVHDESADKKSLKIMFAERSGQTVSQLMSKEKPASAICLVGPEGGWADEEIAEARDAGWKVVTLGGRTLRAETAAISFVALIQHLFGDLN
jgi:16S rRNA (uracil1498-N3)-methyltransferase